MAEDKNLLDKIRDTYYKYDKKLTDAVNYYLIPPEARPLVRGIESLVPFQDLPDATEFIQNPSFKTGLDLATDTAITAAELTPFGYLASRSATLPGKVAQEVTKDLATKSTKLSSTDAVVEALQSFDSLKNLSFDDIKNFPSVSKLNLSDTAFQKAFQSAKKKLNLTTKDIKISAKPNKILGDNKESIINFLTENPGVSNKILIESIPSLKKGLEEGSVSMQQINNFRVKKLNKPVDEKYYGSGGGRNKNLSDDEKDFPFLLNQKNVKLQDRIELVRNLESLYKDGLIGDNAIQIIKAHALGKGKVQEFNISPSQLIAIDNKTKYIPAEFAEKFKNPSFFLTKTENKAHQIIEDNLVNDLVNKYQKLGYEFVGGKNPWKQVKEVDLSLPVNKDLANEVKTLNKKIDGYKKELEKINAYTLFYNPTKNTIVSYGKDIDKIPGLASIVTSIKKGNRKLKDGGLVGIDYLTRPL